MKPKTQNKAIPPKPGKPAGVILKGDQSKRGEVDYSRAIWTRDTTDRPTAAYQALRLDPDPRWPSYSSQPFGVYDGVAA